MPFTRSLAGALFSRSAAHPRDALEVVSKLVWGKGLLADGPGASPPSSLNGSSPFTRCLIELCNAVTPWQSRGSFYANTAGWRHCLGRQRGCPHPDTAVHPAAANGS